MKCTTIAIILVTVVSVPAEPAPPTHAVKDDLGAWVAELPSRLAAAMNTTDLHNVVVKHPEGAILLEGVVTTITIKSRTAAWLAESWHLRRPYVVSTTVHQTQWIVALWQEDLKDPYTKRIALTPITFGVWVVRPIVSERPQGKLPGVVAGASPAYDLESYSSNVVALEISRVTN